VTAVRRALATALATPALLLAGCGSDDTETADPPLPVTPSPTKTHQPPPKPETPEHFIRRWAAEGTRMQNTGDTASWLSLTKHCDGCDSVARLVSKTYQRGGDVSWDGWTFRRVSKHHSGDRWFLDLFVDSAPTRFRPSREAEPKNLPGGRLHYQVQVVPRRHSWLVTSFIQVGS
jgi:hypothetical protein